MRIQALGVVLAVAVLLTGRSAHAQGDYPGEVEDYLKLSYAPPCSLCHEKGNTGSGTVVTSFGWSMRGKGLVVDDPSSIDRALDALRAAKTDSDGDGVPDVDELVAGTDPNSAASVRIPDGKDPGYGCGGEAPDPNRRGEGFMIPVAFGAAAMLRRRRTRRADDRTDG
jgi:hypothetical protein